MNCTSVFVVGAGAVGAVVGAPFLVSALGFTSAGITAGSVASWLMSSSAVASGGGVVAGTMVPLLQSIGAVGLSATGQAVLAATGATVAGVIECLTT